MLIRIIHDENSKYILNYIPEDIEVEIYNIDFDKEKKKAIPIMVRNGTRNVPLITLVENGEETKVIWSETNPDWGKEIKKLLR